ncbi:MAG: tetratricopeptide repeat protein [Thermodesulfobacteriota bacterium]|nr:tetratricopeptide repeat protein [Thermodesulfobacteriota bacterium]
MNLRSLSFSLFLVMLTAVICQAGDPQEAIKMLDHDISQARDPQKKSTLHIYRARQYSKIKKWDKALTDYNDALELNHKGWIHLERSHFLMAMGRYDLACEDATAAKEEVPTLAPEADKIIEAAVAKIRQKYEAENPITIFMDTRVDPYRKTRFDAMKEQGVGMFAASTGTSYKSTRRKPVTSTQKSPPCKPKSRG